MPIRFHCNTCRKGLSIATKKAGTSVQCPSCGSTVAVPGHAIQQGHPPQPRAVPFTVPPQSDLAPAQAGVPIAAGRTGQSASRLTGIIFLAGIAVVLIGAVGLTVATLIALNALDKTDDTVQAGIETTTGLEPAPVLPKSGNETKNAGNQPVDNPAPPKEIDPPLKKEPSPKDQGSQDKTPKNKPLKRGGRIMVENFLAGVKVKGEITLVCDISGSMGRDFPPLIRELRSKFPKDTPLILVTGCFFGPPRLGTSGRPVKFSESRYAKTQRNTSMIRALLNRYDKNKDGMITKSELGRAGSLLKLLDNDKNGVVDQAELKKYQANRSVGGGLIYGVNLLKDPYVYYCNNTTDAVIFAVESLKRDTVMFNNDLQDSGSLQAIAAFDKLWQKQRFTLSGRSLQCDAPKELKDFIQRSGGDFKVDPISRRVSAARKWRK